MRVALFFDGKNFYSGWRDTAQGRRIDFVKLSEWLVKKVGGTSLWGAHYYTGVETALTAGPEAAAPAKLSAFLDVLETQPGYFVYRFPRKVHKVACLKCGADTKYSYEKEVDTTMVADMLRYAAVNAFDVVVLMSGDADYAPAVEGVRSLGKQAFVASWGGAGVSQRIRRAAFDHVDLLAGLATFERAGADGEDLGPREDLPPLAPEESARMKGAFLDELLVAEQKFDGGYVGLGYFVARWRSPALDPSADVRRRLLEDLVHEGKVEIYEAADRAQAIRVVKKPVVA
jgi:uncharacterized LabA/DUF88 family protein